MTNYEEDEKETVVNRIVRVVIFSMVAIIIIVSVALPIFATIGDTTTTYTNNGANAVNVYEKYSTALSGFDNGTSEIGWDANGIYLRGEISGTPVSQKILDKKDYKSGYPLVVILPSHGYLNTVVEYNGTAYNKIVSGVSSATESSGSQSIAQGDRVFVQDPNGNMVFCKEGIYCTDPNNIYGIGYDPANNKFIWTQGNNATTIEGA